MPDDTQDQSRGITVGLLAVEYFGAAVKNPPATAGEAGDSGSVPGSGRSGGGNGNPLQYSCLENVMDRGAWWAIVHRAAESRIAE